MALKKVNHSVFQRMGNSFANFIEHDHFLGRNAFDSPIKGEKNKNKNKNKKED